MSCWMPFESQSFLCENAYACLLLLNITQTATCAPRKRLSERTHGLLMNILEPERHTDLVTKL